MIRRIMTKNAVCITALSVIILSGCAKAQSGRVCASEETMQTVSSLLFDRLLGDRADFDILASQQAFDEAVTLDLIRFEGQDEETQAISCRARVQSPSTRGLIEVQYQRQPEADGSGFVYSIALQPSDMVSWAEVTMDTIARHRASLQRSETEQSEPLAGAAPASKGRTTDSTAAVARDFAASALRASNERSARMTAANGENASEATSYDASEPVVRAGDMDGDGDEDLAVMVTLCAQGSCHPTTYHSAVALFRNDGGSYAQTFTRVIEGDASFKSVGQQGTIIETIEMGPDDPGCCPSQVRRHTFSLGGEAADTGAPTAGNARGRVQRVVPSLDLDVLHGPRNPEPRPAQTITPATGNSIQIGAYSSRTLAERESSAILRRFSDIAGSGRVVMRNVVARSGATLVRTSIVMPTNDQAATLCDAMRASGIDCIIR